jgi:hypothetical protein
MIDGVFPGNASAEGQLRKGWFVGQFVDLPGDGRSTTALEVKWGIHPKNEANERFAANKQATTCSILIEGGPFRLTFRSADKTEVVRFEKLGDYAVWLPGVYHDWLAENDCVILTVRWPSLQNDQVFLAP